MKKTLLLAILSAVVLCAFAGCTGPQENTADNAASATAAATVGSRAEPTEAPEILPCTSKENFEHNAETISDIIYTSLSRQKVKLEDSKYNKDTKIFDLLKDKGYSNIQYEYDGMYYCVSSYHTITVNTDKTATETKVTADTTIGEMGMTTILVDEVDE